MRLCCSNQNIKRRFDRKDIGRFAEPQLRLLGTGYRINAVLLGKAAKNILDEGRRVRVDVDVRFVVAHLVFSPFWAFACPHYAAEATQGVHARAARFVVRRVQGGRGRLVSSLASTPLPQPRCSGHVIGVERVMSQKVLRLQTPLKPLLNTADAKAAAERLHSCCLPHRIANGVDLAMGVDGLLNADVVPLHCHKGLLRLNAIGQSRCRVEAAVDAGPAFGHETLQVRRFGDLLLRKSLLYLSC
jgi:hypothetical protein